MGLFSRRMNPFLNVFATSKSRTRILLLSPSHFGKEADIAVQLGIEGMDYAEGLLARLPQNARFANITASSQEEALNEIATAEGNLDCVLVYNFDLALARLERAERENLWKNLRDRFPYRKRALLLAVPQAAEHLLPTGEEWSLWTEGRRIALASEM